MMYVLLFMVFIFIIIKRIIISKYYLLYDMIHDLLF